LTAASWGQWRRAGVCQFELAMSNECFGCLSTTSLDDVK
jgi:hypothetical protein